MLILFFLLFNDGFVSNGGVTVEIIPKVIKIKEKYHYSYKFKNIGKKTAVIGWEIIDKAIFQGVPLTWTLEPNETIEIKLIHKDAPQWIFGNIRLMVSGNGQKWQDFFKEKDIEFPIKEFKHTTLFGHLGPIPKSFIKSQD